MNNIHLKTLTFPGLEHTYIIPSFTTYEITLSATGWTDNGAPYAQIKEISGLTDDHSVIAYPVYSGITATDVAMAESCCALSYASHSGNSIMFVCLTDKPSSDIRVALEVRT